MSMMALVAKNKNRDLKGLFVSADEPAISEAELPEEESQGAKEVHSNYFYPKEYKRPRSIMEQIWALAEIFHLNPKNAFEMAKNLSKFPACADGWFAIPSIDALARDFFPDAKSPDEKYCRAVKLVLERIAILRPFCNYRQTQIDPAHLRVCAHTAKAMDRIIKKQKGDIHIIATQFGMRHRGRSVRQVRKVLIANEFGLTSFAVCSIFLTHPERLVRWDELFVDIPGDEFSDNGDGRFNRAPFLGFLGRRIRFASKHINNAYDHSGSVSGFDPSIVVPSVYYI
jgi:hypothetical protein